MFGFAAPTWALSGIRGYALSAEKEKEGDDDDDVVKNVSEKSLHEFIPVIYF